MITKITDILKKKSRTYSFEFFPPKTPKGMESLFEVAAALKELKPDWFSVTYGAGGSTRELTMSLVDELQTRFKVPTMHHLSCGGHSRAELVAIIEEMKRRNIHNVLALRGDPPQGVERWEPGPDELEYCHQLITLIRTHNGFFSIGVAGFPESHILCPDRETDAKYLKMKIDAGGDFVITQLFFTNRDYIEYVDRLRRIGVTVRVIPGILPITNYQKSIEFSVRCGAKIPQRVHDTFKPLDGNAQVTYEAGVRFAVKQCQELLAAGAPGLHFYTLNKLDPTREVMNKLER